MNQPSPKRLAIVVFVVIILAITAAIIWGAPTPTPRPAFTITDEEISKLSWDDILATVKHQQKIFKQEHETVLQLEAHLATATIITDQAIKTTMGGLVHVNTLEEGIQLLADHDKKETERANKLDKALWWYRVHWWGAWVMLGLGVLACVLMWGGKIVAKLSAKATEFGV